MSSKDRHQAWVNTHNVMGEQREQAFKYAVVASGALSLLSLMAFTSALPMLYNSVTTSRMMFNEDFTFCQESIENVLESLKELREQRNKTVFKRYAPNGMLGSERDETNFKGIVVFQECPACCKPGERGAPGEPGLPGLPGSPGSEGAEGRPGRTPNASCIPERVYEPPPCLPCPQGPRGPVGHPGFPGDSGNPGIMGRPGNQGPPGEPGPAGIVGEPGAMGPVGAPGDEGLPPETKIALGPPGDQGEPGIMGPPGDFGVPGENGPPGAAGEKGCPGDPGDAGDVGIPGLPGPMGESGAPGLPGACVCHDTEIIIEDAKGRIPAHYGSPYEPVPPPPPYEAQQPSPYDASMPIDHFETEHADQEHLMPRGQEMLANFQGEPQEERHLPLH